MHNRCRQATTRVVNKIRYWFNKLKNKRKMKKLGNKKYTRWGPPPVILNSKGVCCSISECYKIPIDSNRGGK